MIGYVGIVHVGPEAHLFGEILPHALVFPHALLTLLDEGRDAVFLDLLLTVQTKRLFHFQLHRKSVGVPARFSGNHIALHGAVSGDHVLDGTGLHMADMGLAVCGRRSVIEGIGRAALPDFQALLKDFVLFPEFLDFLFPAHKIQVGVHFFIKRHLLPSFLNYKSVRGDAVRVVRTLAPSAVAVRQQLLFARVRINVFFYSTGNLLSNKKTPSL